MKRRRDTLFAKMWLPLVLLLLGSFIVNAVLVTATLQLGSEAQTERRLARIGDHWSSQLPTSEPFGLDPVTVLYPRYDMLPDHIQAMLEPSERGIFELGPRAKDYFVLSRDLPGGGAFYVVENHSEVKPEETLEWQVFSWYAIGIVPFSIFLLWLCARITSRVAAPMQEIGNCVDQRPADSLEPLALPAGSPSELEVLVEQLNRSFRRTAEALERERSFTRFASHELRTPAAVMQAALERLSRTTSAEHRKALERAQRGLRDMNALIDTFLRLSRDDTFKAPDRSAIKIDAVWISSLYWHICGTRPIKPLVFVHSDELVLFAQETILHVLIGNMLKNAVFHGGQEQIQISITSNGIEILNTIAEEPTTPGFGIGCTIARQICERYGWHFSLMLEGGIARAAVLLHSPLRANSDFSE